MTSRARKLTTIARIALGLVFTVFGANGFLQFLPQPPMPADAGAFLGALLATGYMFPLLKTFELGAGLLLLSNRHVPLALLLLAPIIVNISAFHVFLAPGGLLLPVLVIAMEIDLAWTYRASFAPTLAIEGRAGADDRARAGRRSSRRRVTRTTCPRPACAHGPAGRGPRCRRARAPGRTRNAPRRRRSGPARRRPRSRPAPGSAPR